MNMVGPLFGGGPGPFPPPKSGAVTIQIHERKGHLKLPCSLTTQGKNYECHPAHSFQFIILLGGYKIVSTINHAHYILRLISVSTPVMWYL